MQYILTLFIVIATSRPVNKKSLFAVSPRIQHLLRICLADTSALRSPHTSAALTWGHALSVSLLTNEPCVFD